MQTESWMDLAEKLCVIVPVVWAVTLIVLHYFYKKIRQMLLSVIQSQLSLILAEVKPNGGKSLKDVAVDLQRTQAEQTLMLGTLTAGQDQIREEIGAVKSNQAQVKKDLGDTDGRLARFIVHEARGNLQGSMLAAEAERLLIEKNSLPLGSSET